MLKQLFERIAEKREEKKMTEEAFDYLFEFNRKESNFDCPFVLSKKDSTKRCIKEEEIFFRYFIGIRQLFSKEEIEELDIESIEDFEYFNYILNIATKISQYTYLERFGSFKNQDEIRFLKRYLNHTTSSLDIKYGQYMLQVFLIEYPHLKLKQNKNIGGF